MAKKGASTASAGPIGSLLFLVGAVVAVVAGFLSSNGMNSTMASALIVLGIIVGFLNVTTRETNSFLLASVSLIIVSALGGAVLSSVAVIGGYLEGVLLAILTFVVPSSIIVALKSIYSLEASR